MTAPAADIAHTTERRSPWRIVLILIAAIAVAVALNTLVAALAVQAGAGAGFGPLTFPAYASFTAIGIVVGWIGWRLVERRAARPRRALSILVPAVILLSFVPDVVLLATGFIPGTTVEAVVALMAMHVVVALVAVPAYVLASRTRS